MNKLLTDSVREVLQSQYPNEDIVEIDECIYHVPHTEEAWESLRDKVRPGWKVMLEERGLRHYIIYNPKQYKKCMLVDSYIIRCHCITENIELPINCSSCCEMFYSSDFTNGFRFAETFDTSEVVDMEEMFRFSKFLGDVSLGDNFKTDKVKNFSYMFQCAKIIGNLDLGPNFNLENADTVRCMFNCIKIKKPIKFGDKFNPKNALDLFCMFSESRMPKGFNLGNNFHVRKGATVENMFRYIKFNEDFWLPDCFSIDEENQDCTDIFKDAELPKRIRGIDRENVQGIIEALKVKDGKIAIDYLNGI